MVLKNVTDWETLGGKLGISDSKIKEISLDFRGNNHQKCEMIGFWLKSDTSATWEKLCKALEQMDENVLAKQIRKDF